jgi:hypothetical protein
MDNLAAAEDQGYACRFSNSPVGSVTDQKKSTFVFMPHMNGPWGRFVASLRDPPVV